MSDSSKSTNAINSIKNEFNDQLETIIMHFNILHLFAHKYNGIAFKWLWLLTWKVRFTVKKVEMHEKRKKKSSNKISLLFYEITRQRSFEFVAGRSGKNQILTTTTKKFSSTSYVTRANFMNSLSCYFTYIGMEISKKGDAFDCTYTQFNCWYICFVICGITLKLV